MLTKPRKERPAWNGSDLLSTHAHVSTAPIDTPYIMKPPISSRNTSNRSFYAPLYLLPSMPRFVLVIVLMTDRATRIRLFRANGAVERVRGVAPFAGNAHDGEGGSTKRRQVGEHANTVAYMAGCLR